MYRKIRNLHMWLGLILTIILLSEAITGLILSEPWIVGQPPKEASHKMEHNQLHAGNALSLPAGEDRHSDIVEFIRELHEGEIGNINFRWLIDLAAIGIIILTLSGIYLSTPFLRTYKNRR